MSSNILCVAFTPALQRILTFSEVTLGAVNRASTQELSAAGKGVNVAKVIKTLGSEPSLTGFLGGGSGQAVARYVEALNLKAHWLWDDAETRNAHTLINKSSGEVTELVEEAVNPAEALWKEAFVLIRRLLEDMHAVGLCGALAPGSNPAIYAEIIKIAHAQEVPCIVDAKGDVLELALNENPFLVKINREELAHTTGCTINSEQDVLQGMRKLQDAGAGHVMVTQGKDSAYLGDHNDFWCFEPPRVDALNPIGSGDSVTAGILHAHCAGEPLVDAVAYGIACGAANAETSKPGEISATRVNELLQQVHFLKLSPA